MSATDERLLRSRIQEHFRHVVGHSLDCQDFLTIRICTEWEVLSRLDKLLGRARLGDAHPTTLEALQNRAWAWQVEGVLESGAAPLVREVLQTCRSLKFRTCRIRVQLGSCKAKQKHQEATSLWYAIIRADCDNGRGRAVFGNDHPKTLSAINHQARFLIRL